MYPMKLSLFISHEPIKQASHLVSCVTSDVTPTVYDVVARRRRRAVTRT